MPLLCKSLALAFLLLPLSLSCDSKRPPTEVRRNYLAIVQTDLENTRGSIATLLQNSSCPEPKQKPNKCLSSNVDVVSNLHNLTCKMKNLGLSHTKRLVTSVLNSIGCPCLERPTKEPNVRTTTRQRRNEKKKNKKKTRKLCKGKAILSTMTECYEVLNNIFMDT